MGINGFKFLLILGIVAVMLLFFQVPVSACVIYAIPSLTIFFMVTFAFGIFFMHWGVYIEDLSYVVSILLNMMMFFTGIFYSLEARLEYPYGILLETINPIAFLMTSVRKSVMYSQIPDLKLMLGWLVLAIILSIVGIRSLYKNENDYVKVI